MKHIGWFIIIWAMLLGFSLQLKAQHISVSAPTHVAAGENFRVAYTINTRDVEEFRMGGVGEGLEVIAGPYTSSQSSYQMINGHTSSSSSVTITYTLYAAKNGTFGIGASHAIVNGKKLSSHPVKITVSGHAARNNGAPSMHGQNDFIILQSFKKVFQFFDSFNNLSNLFNRSFACYGFRVLNNFFSHILAVVF